MSAIRIGVMRTVSGLANTNWTLGGAKPSWLDQSVQGVKQAGQMFVALLTPASVVALALGLWCIGATLGSTQAFPVSDGMFSHWQVWMVLAVLVKTTATMLARFAPSAPKTTKEG